LIARLLMWAKEHPDGKELCSLPKLHWCRGNDQDQGTLTSFQRNERDVLDHSGTIFMAFHIDCWWYEIADLGRKLVLNGFIIFVGQDSSAQVAAGCFVCIFMMTLHARVNPYYGSVQNCLSQVCLVQLSCILFLGLLFKLDPAEDDDASSNVLSILIVLFTSCLVVVPLVNTVLTYFMIGCSVRSMRNVVVPNGWATRRTLIRYQLVSSDLQLFHRHIINSQTDHTNTV